MDDAVTGEQLHDRIDRWKNCRIKKVRVILVLILLPLKRLAISGQLFRRNILKRRDAGEPPFGKGAIEHGDEGYSDWPEIQPSVHPGINQFNTIRNGPTRDRIGC